MSNSYYNHTTYPTPNSPGSSAALRAELEAITDGFDLLPTLTGNGYKVAMINAAGTAMVASSALQSLAITGSTIDSTPIGATTRAAGNFTTLSATGAVTLGSSVTIAGGTINGTQIGNTTPSSGAFTTVSASSGFTGNLTGNVTGNLTGNVTGNVTGDLTGNVTASSGTSSFNNVTINGTLDMNAGSAGTITGLAAPSGSTDAANKGYVDTQVATRLALAGGTMAGNIAMGGNLVTGLGTPTNSGDATSKTYVDAADALKLNLSGGTMSGAIAMGTNKITGLGTPTADADAATKAYVDGVAQGLDVKASVRAATTGNITLSGTQNIDGVSLIAGDRVLVKDQLTAAENGIYVVASGSWTRASDMDAWAEFPSAFTFVEQGTVNDNSGWVCTVAPGGTLGSTSVTFEQFSGAGQITAGAGLTKSGNTINVNTASSSRIVVGADEIDLATTGVTASTYRSVTVDQWGRVTGGTNPTTLAGYGITDAYTTTQVDTALALKLNLSGGTLSGNLAMGTNRITGLGDPTNAQDAATRNYVDTADALKLNLSGGTMSGAIAMGANKITGMADPTSAQDAATKAYTDSILGSATSAAASAAAAAISETNAGNSATSASNSAIAAANSATAAANTYDAFDDRYLGSKTSDPTVDNDGNPLLTGALYWNSSVSIMKVYDGSAWAAAYLPAAGYLPTSGGTMTGTITFAAGQTFPGTQDTLVSGTNIKTINGTSILGSGNIVISSGVTSFNTRTGAVTLASSDVTDALGYTPAGLAGNNSFSGTNEFNAVTVYLALTASNTLSLTGNGTGTHQFASLTTSGTVTIGGVSQTGLMTIGRATTNSTTQIQAGAATSGRTKTIDLGTGGLSGSTTTITIGSSTGTTNATANGTWSFPGSASQIAAVLADAAEVATVSATAATGTINFDVTTSAVQYYTTNASGNWTLNVRGSSGTSLNTLLATGQSVTIAFLVTNGATAYYQSAFQIDGASVTPKWQGGTAPTAGNASSIDAYVITIIKTGSATFTALASQTKFA